MARGATGWSIAGNFMLADDVFLSGDGFAVLMWKYHVSGKSTSFCLGKTGILSHHRRMFISTDDGWRVGSFYNPTGEPGDGGYDSEQDHTGGQVDLSATPVTPNQWHHIGGAWISSTSRRARLGTGTVGTHTTLATPNAPNELALGVRADRAEGLDTNESIAWPSFWDISTMTTTGIDALFALGATAVDGFAPNPLAMDLMTGEEWSGRLIAAPDLDFTSSTFGQDLTGNGHDFTVQGTLSTFGSWPLVRAVSDGGAGRVLFTAAGRMF